MNCLHCYYKRRIIHCVIEVIISVFLSDTYSIIQYKKYGIHYNFSLLGKDDLLVLVRSYYSDSKHHVLSQKFIHNKICSKITIFVMSARKKSMFVFHNYVTAVFSVTEIV